MLLRGSGGGLSQCPLPVRCLIPPPGKRVNASANRPWHLYVLDLRTLAETPLAEEHSIDDQAAWLDDHTVMYGRPRQSGGEWDVWAVAADGGGAPRVLVPDASSPTVLRAGSG